MAFRRPPRPIPALEVFPTLKRFAKQKYHPFQPRNDRIPPGTQHPYSRGLRVQSMSHLYHDLGVMVFAGTTDRQTRKIGDILKESMAHPGGLPSLLGYKYDDGSRYTVYNVGRKAMKSINGVCRSELPPEFVVTDGVVRSVGWVNGSYIDLQNRWESDFAAKRWSSFRIQKSYIRILNFNNMM